MTRFPFILTKVRLCSSSGDRTSVSIPVSRDCTFDELKRQVVDFNLWPIDCIRCICKGKVIELSEEATTLVRSFYESKETPLCPYSCKNPDLRDLIVSNAGTASVNGTYKRDGMYNGKPRYRKEENGLMIRWRYNQWRLGYINDCYYISETENNVTIGWRMARPSSTPPEFPNKAILAPSPSLSFPVDTRWEVQIVSSNMIDRVSKENEKEEKVKKRREAEQALYLRQISDRVARDERKFVQNTRAAQFANALALRFGKKARKAKARAQATKATGFAAEAALRAVQAAQQAEEIAYTAYEQARNRRDWKLLACESALEASSKAREAAIVARDVALAAAAAVLAWKVAEAAANKTTRLAGKAHRAWRKVFKEREKRVKIEKEIQREKEAKMAAENALNVLGLSVGARSREIERATLRLQKSKKVRKSEDSKERLEKIQSARDLLLSVDTDPLIVEYSKNPDRL
eukprot:g655.t1